MSQVVRLANRVLTVALMAVVSTAVVTQVATVDVDAQARSAVLEIGSITDDGRTRVSFLQSLSRDGDEVFFQTLGSHGYRYQRSAGLSTRLTGDARYPGKLLAASATGEFTIFKEGSTSGPFFNGNVVRQDLESGEIVRVNELSSGERVLIGASAPAEISDNGNIVVFADQDTGEIYVRNVAEGTTMLLEDRLSEQPRNRPRKGLSISADGRYVAYNAEDGSIYRYEVATGVRDVVSINLTGINEPHAGQQPDISADGRFVTYQVKDAGSYSGQIVVRDMASTDRVELITRTADGEPVRGASSSPSLSDDGRFVAFGSASRELVPQVPAGQQQAYVFDRSDGSIRVVSVNAEGEFAEAAEGGAIRAVRISGDGSTVAFTSEADNLVPADRLGVFRVFVLDLTSPPELTCDGLTVSIVGSGHIVGTDGDDVILGSLGIDVIEGGDGNDVICAAGGDDQINGGPGHDRILAGTGDDQIDGGPGDDHILAGLGDDQIDGGPGDDHVLAGIGDDQIDGGPGDDHLLAGAGEDLVNGQAGDDTINGGSENDVLWGNLGADIIAGEEGDDRLIGGPGDDELIGGAGDDWCRGSAGLDRYFRCETTRV